jgi:HAMP domain-containing protein
MDETTLEEYKQLVEEQGRVLLDAIQSVALGDLDIQVPTLKGIDVLSDLAIGLEMMIDDLREMMAEQERARTEIEEARQQTEAALADVLAAQRRYLRQEWEGYTAEGDAVRGYFRFGDGEGPTADAWLPTMTGAVEQVKTVVEGDREEGTTLALPIHLYGEVVGALGFSRKEAESWSEDEIDAVEAIVRQVAQALESQRLFEEAQEATFLMSERVKDLDSLNDIGRRMEESPPIPEFLGWVAERVANAMRYSDVCLVAIEYEGQVYGMAEATSLPRQIVQALRVSGEVVGRICVAYTLDRQFLDEESALLGDIARRVSGYIENQRLFQAAEARAERERRVRTITDRMRRGTDTKTIVRIAIEELSQAFGTSELFVSLGSRAHQNSEPSQKEMST